MELGAIETIGFQRRSIVRPPRPPLGVLLVALLVLEKAGADYVWDGEQWQWFVKSS